MLNKQTILLADHDPAKHASLVRMLKEEFEILLAKDGIAAVRVYDNNIERVSAVIIDLRIPRLNGRAVTEWMHHIAPKLPIIVTSDTLDDDANELRQCAAVSVVVRPVKPPAIPKLLHQSLEKSVGFKGVK